MLNIVTFFRIIHDLKVLFSHLYRFLSRFNFNKKWILHFPKSSHLEKFQSVWCHPIPFFVSTSHNTELYRLPVSLLHKYCILNPALIFLSCTYNSPIICEHSVPHNFRPINWCRSYLSSDIYSAARKLGTPPNKSTFHISVQGTEWFLYQIKAFLKLMQIIKNIKLHKQLLKYLKITVFGLSEKLGEIFFLFGFLWR